MKRISYIQKAEVDMFVSPPSLVLREAADLDDGLSCDGDFEVAMGPVFRGDEELVLGVACQDW